MTEFTRTELTAEIVAAYVAHNPLPISALPELLRRCAWRHRGSRQASARGASRTACPRSTCEEVCHRRIHHQPGGWAEAPVHEALSV